MTEINKSELVKKVEARKKFVRKVVKFVSQILRERGKVIERSVGSCNIHVIEELINFEDFSFRGDFGQTMFGGETINVVYHPDKLITSFPKLIRSDLEVYWQGTFDIKECKVEVFNEDPKWQEALNRVIRNKRSIAKKLDDQKKKSKKKASSTLQRLRDEEKLKSEANRLGINSGK